METIERIPGREIPILPEPFIPEGELRPLTEADFQRLFEEFCAAWKSRARVTPCAEVALTPDNFI